MIAGYLGLAGSYPFVCETLWGDQIRVADRSDLATVWIIYLRNEYNVRPEDRMILDCGANIGAFSVFAVSRARSARIVAIEPFPSTFERLVKSVETQSSGTPRDMHSSRAGGGRPEREYVCGSAGG